MKSASLPRWLARLFAFLFYGQLTGYALCIGVYMAVFGLPTNSNLSINASLNGVVSASSPRPESGPLHNWSKSTFALDLNLPGTLSHNPLTSPSLYLNLSLNGPTDLAKLPGLLLFSVAGIFLVVLLSLFVCYQFMAVFTNLANRRIFDQGQINRLTRIGVSLFGYAVLAFMLNRLVERGAIIYLEEFGYSISHPTAYTVGLGTLSAEAGFALAGLCVLALTQVFTHGMELKQENELTI